MFPCEKCGACCRSLNTSPLYADLDRGDGVCRYLQGNLCSIYEQRPMLCRIDQCYELFYKEQYSLEEYYQLNLDLCHILQQKEALKNSSDKSVLSVLPYMQIQTPHTDMQLDASCNNVDLDSEKNKDA